MKEIVGEQFSEDLGEGIPVDWEDGWEEHELAYESKEKVELIGDEEAQELFLGIEEEEDGLELDDVENEVFGEYEDSDGVDVNDPVGLYFRQMAREPLLSPEEELELARRIKTGKLAGNTLKIAEKREMGADYISHLQVLIDDGDEAREHLARANTRLVVSVAKKYMYQGMTLLDLIGEGNVGLMRAVDKFDYRRKRRFATYATYWIKQVIIRSLSQKTRTIRLPDHVIKELGDIFRVARELEITLNRPASAEEIGVALNQPSARVKELLAASRHAEELERPVGQGESNVGDFIEDTNSPDPVEESNKNLRRAAIEDALAQLSPRQAQVLIMRFGLGKVSKPMTLEEIGSELGLTRERIRQIEKGIFKKLRHPRFANSLEDFLG